MNAHLQKLNWAKSYKNRNGNAPVTFWPPKSTGAPNRRNVDYRANTLLKAYARHCSDCSFHLSISSLFIKRMPCVRWRVRSPPNRQKSYSFGLLNVPFSEVVRAMTYVISQGWAMYWGTSRWSQVEVRSVIYSRWWCSNWKKKTDFFLV